MNLTLYQAHSLAQVFRSVPKELYTRIITAQLFGKNQKQQGEVEATLCRNGDAFWTKTIDGEVYVYIGHIVKEHIDGVGA